MSYTSGRCTYYCPKPTTKYPILHTTDDDVKEALEEAKDKFEIKEFLSIPIVFLIPQLYVFPSCLGILRNL